MRERRRIQINGVVQGVGFRPTVYRYALESKLAGYVNNSAQGVIIEIEGETSSLLSFIVKLKNSPPPKARIDLWSEEIIAIRGDSKFVIIESQNLGNKNVSISPDLATCEDCLRETFDQTNRRYLYPFTNCTNCGPRFSIIQDRPYDRPFTSMSKFPLCPDCSKEYHDPLDRRFHAQPNACSVCGPKLYWVDEETNTSDILSGLTARLRQGAIVAIKGIGGFNIVLDPRNREALSRLRINKRRPNQSFAVMMKNIEVAKQFVFIDEDEESELLSSCAPIVLCRKKNQNLDQISSDNNYLGIILPYTPLHHLLMKDFDTILFTSGNMRNGPIAISDEAAKVLKEKKLVDFILSNNRDIVHRLDDSICQFINGKKQVIRRGRGVVPGDFKIPATTDMAILGVGANLKNTFSIRHKDQIWVSSHMGDLMDLDNFDHQNAELDDFLRLMELAPQKIICDLHPNYQNYSSQAHKVQHHHAHALSAMGEHSLLGREVLAIVADGTGFGDNNSIWGFEFLQISKNYQNYKRIASLKEFQLPGGEKAIHDVRRIAYSLVRESSPEMAASFFKDRDWSVISSIMKNNVNSPWCSSLGRLFDGVAALLGVCTEAEYEGRAAILLQKYAENAESKKGVNDIPVEFEIDSQMVYRLDWRPLILRLISDYQRGAEVSGLAFLFHLWLVDAMLLFVEDYRHLPLVFSGGCFQNKLLVSLLVNKLNELGYEFYFNHEVPINDGGISFGQVLI